MQKQLLQELLINVNLQLQTLIAKKNKIIQVGKDWYYYPFFVLNPIFVEDLKTQILKFEAKKK